MHTTAVLFTDANTVELGKVEIPDPGPGEVLVEAAYTCISPGTELRCLGGHQPYRNVWPVVPGYAMTGRVAVGGPDTTIAEGAPVFCSGTSRASITRLWGGHVAYAVVPEEKLFPLGGDSDLLELSAAKLTAIAYHGLRLSQPSKEDRVAVMGLGPIGLLSAKLHAHTGATVVGIDPRQSRIDFAREAGIDAITPDEAAELFGGKMDVVVDATGRPAAFPEAIALAKMPPYDDEPHHGARILVQGSYADSFEVPYQDAFNRELTLLLPRDCQPRDIRAALKLIQIGEVRVRDIITQVFSPACAPDVYAELRKPDSRLMTAAFSWR